MIAVEAVEELKPVEARSIIESLCRGSVPVEHVLYFTVGRERWLQIIEDDLANYIAAGGAKVRFLSGDYGDGKTHFLSVVQHLVQREGFAVSFVVLTREVPMNKFELVYQETVARLMTAPGRVGIRAVLNDWLETLAPKFATADEEERAAALQKMAETLKDLDGMDINFAQGLVSLVQHHYWPPEDDEAEETREQAREVLYQWFEGIRLSKRELRPFQIFESLNKNNSKRLLSSLIAFLLHQGYRGLILLLDELETVMGQSASVRNGAYENVRLLIDNAEQAHHLHVFFSIIPDVILAEKGFKSYNALWSRVRSVNESDRLNYRSIVIDLHRTPLENAELVELGRRLRRIHELAYRWEAANIVTDDYIVEACETQQRMGLLAEVRLYIKQVIRYLDMAEQDGTLEGVDPAEQLVATQREITDAQDDGQRPAWDA
ncbi:ATPase [Candidatus Entotheonella serta]|nr:ATPase [Candidatus Entotheonella serta]